MTNPYLGTKHSGVTSAPPRFFRIGAHIPNSPFAALYRLHGHGWDDGEATVRKYAGSCHCGAVRFEIETDLTEATECSCSICTKKGALHHRVPPERFTLVAGRDALALYQFGTKKAKHWFCKHCGMHPFGNPRAAPDMVIINIRCLDDYDAEKANIEVRTFDGRNWEDAMRRFTF